MTLSKEEQVERELRVHLYAYARLAIGGQPTDKVSVALQKMCERTFPPAYPSLISKMAPSRRPQPELNSGPGVDYGFATRERAFWIKRHFLSTFGFRDDDFDGRTFHTSGAEFAKKNGEEWLAGRIAIELHKLDAAFLNGLGVRAGDIRPLGFVVAGSMHGIVWIGTVRDLSIASESDGNIRALRIQQLVQHVGMETEARWPNLLTDAALTVMVRDHSEAFVQLALTELERFAGGKYEENLAILDGAVNDFAGRLQCLVIPPQKTDTASLGELRTALKRESRSDVDGVLVITDLPDTLASEEVEAFVRSRDNPMPRFFVVDPSGLLRLTADRPWAWSAHLGQAWSFRVLPGDRFPAPTNSFVLRTWPATEDGTLPLKLSLRQRAVTDLIGERTTFFTGRPDSGRSVAIYQAVRRYHRKSIVLTDHHEQSMRATDLPLMQTIVRDMIRGGRRVVVILDDADTSERCGLLREWAAVGQSAPNGSFTILAAMRETDEATARIGNVIPLDNPGRRYRERLLRYAARRFRVEVSTAAETAFVDRATRKEATTGDMLQALARHASTVLDERAEVHGFIDVKEPYWAEKRRRLTNDAQRLLDILAFLRAFDWEQIQVDAIVRAYAREMWRMEDVATPLQELSDEGWISLADNEVFCANWETDLFAPYFTAETGFYMPHPVAVRFVNATIDSKVLPLDLKRQVLGSTFLVDAFHSQPRDLQRIEKAFAALTRRSNPGWIQRLINRLRTGARRPSGS